MDAIEVRIIIISSQFRLAKSKIGSIDCGLCNRFLHGRSGSIRTDQQLQSNGSVLVALMGWFLRAIQFDKWLHSRRATAAITWFHFWWLQWDGSSTHVVAPFDKINGCDGVVTPSDKIDRCDQMVPFWWLRSTMVLLLFHSTRSTAAMA